MKHKKIVLAMLASLLSLMGCKSDGEELATEAEKLYISVSCLPFADDEAPLTRAANHGFLTLFEEGDEIGVTGLDASGNVIGVCDNVRFVCHRQEGADGEPQYSFVNDRSLAKHNYSMADVQFSVRF